jgi:choline dehydrogenase
MAFIRRARSTYNHPVGTCAMGSGREAVVDAELRVRRVEGLRIADASVMPTIPSADTNAPSVMVGEFASRLLVDGRTAARSGRDADVSAPAPIVGESLIP